MPPRRLVSCALATAACLSVSVAFAEPASLPSKENFHLFLLIGQSNMAGRGTVEPQDQAPHPRVLTLNKAGAWVPAVDPIHFDKAIAGVGLGRTFGIEIAEATPGATIGLIPCAVGGTPIDAWKPGALWDKPKSHPWDDAMVRAKLALEAGTLKGILWHQGESDSKRDLAPAYAGKLADLIARLRAELGAPEVPFIVGQPGQFAGRPWDEFQRMLDQTLRDLPARVPHTAYVSAEGLTDRGDKLHFNSESYREFGRRYAAAYRQLTGMAATGSRQVVLLKLDDLVDGRDEDVVSPRWQRVADFLTVNTIKASFGIICESLEGDNPAYFEWIKKLHREGVIEFWLHGYHRRQLPEPGEFDHGTFEEQKAILEKSERLAREKLGFTFAAFGPHWSATTEATDRALEALPDLAIWLYGPKRPKFFSRLSLPRVMGLEVSTGVPDAMKFKETYAQVGSAQPVLVLQGHPNQWDDRRWQAFLDIIAFLQSKRAVFMTPSEYLRMVRAGSSNA